MALRASAWIALVALTSCSLLTPLGGLSNGEREGADDAAGGADASASDAAPDGATDGSLPTADSGFSCATLTPAARLCVDFSNELVVSTGSPTASSFEGGEKEGAPDAVIDRSIFFSPSASARFSFTAAKTRSFLQRTFLGATPTRIEFAMAMRLDTAGADTDLDLMEIRLGDEAGLFLKLRSGGSLVVRSYSQGQTAREIPLPSTIPNGRFVRYAWEVDLGAQPNVTMRIDGVEVLTRAALLTFTSAAKTTFIAGCTDYNTNVASTLWVDDIVVRF